LKLTFNFIREMEAGGMTNDEARDVDFEPTVAREVAHVLQHLNEGHGDTIVMMARFAGGASGLVSATLERADRSGVLIRGRQGDGSSTLVRLLFSGRPDSLLTMRAQLFALLRTARTRAGATVPLTSLEQELEQTANLHTFVTAVEQVDDVTPALRRIVVRGGLDGFVPRGPDQFVYVMVPRPGGDPSLIAPGFRMEHFQQMPETERPAGAYYTVRRWDAERGAMELWFVLHHEDAGVGGWARRAQPGDRVALWGPRTSFAPPADTQTLLLVADESGLAATAAILEELDPGVRAHVVVETSDADHVVELPSRPQVSVTWLFRAHSARRLADEVRHLDLDPTGLYAFGAAEAGEVDACRRHLRQERALSPAQVRMVAYWRRTPLTATAAT
jgi:NADPH-dependent ferric siderophore reductase